jgi:hypothetical protein
MNVACKGVSVLHPHTSGIAPVVHEVSSSNAKLNTHVTVLHYEKITKRKTAYSWKNCY